MAQSEHTGGVAVLFTPSTTLAKAVNAELERQVASIQTEANIRESFALRSGVVITKDIHEAISLADHWAPEHFCLSVAQPWDWLGQIKRAGGIFIGEHSYEVLGDYVAGPSHVMPTGGTARFTSPCNILDFVRVMNIIALNESSAKSLAPAAITLAESEGLMAHANAAKVRLS
jgi:histidinol dehydrogenase